MREAEGAALYKLLFRTAKSIRLALVGHSRRHSANCSGCHAKNICVETVRMNNIDFIFFQKALETPKLIYEIQIIKAGQGEFRNLTQTKTICLSSQHTFVLQAGNPHSASPPLVQLAHKLEGLALAATLLEAINHVQNVWDHFRPPSEQVLELRDRLLPP